MDTNVLIIGGVGGVCWSLAYILIIRRSFIDDTFGVPFIALCANVTWELIFSFIIPPESIPQRTINIVWFALDIMIVAAYLRYGKKDFTNLLPQSFFYLTFFGVAAICFLLSLTSVYEFNDTEGKYSAFFIDFIMSVLYIVMMLQRGNPRGQSFYIAAFKWIGSACYTIVFYSMFPQSLFLLALFLLTFAFNLSYTILIYRFIQREGMNPLARF